LQNQVTDVIPAMTPVRELEWDRGGRAKVKELVAFIEERSRTDGKTNHSTTLPPHL
jgi:hypothetical protein